MEKLQCENCGSKNIEEVNGVATCLSCGTKYPEIELKKLGIHEEFKEKEIRRKEEEIDGLITPQFEKRISRIFGETTKTYGFTANGNPYWFDAKFWGGGEFVVEPRQGILSDDEILKYAPKSKAAKKIRKQRKKG